MSGNNFRDILESHPAYVLRALISKHNIRGYSKMKKEEIIGTMMQYKSRFNHLKHYVRPARKPRKATKPRKVTKPRKPRQPRKKKAPPIPPRRPVVGMGLSYYRR